MDRRNDRKRKIDSRHAIKGPPKKRRRRSSKDSHLQYGYSDRFEPSPFYIENRKKRERDRRRKMIVGWPLAILSAVALIMVIATLVAYLPQFYIERVTVSGLRLIAREDIMELIDKSPGEHFIGGIGGEPIHYLTLRYGNIEDKIKETHHLVRSVKVQFRFPSEVRVTVVEKTEILAIRITGGFALLDSELSVIRIANERDFDIPVLEGIRVESTPLVDEKIEVGDETQLFSAINITASLIEHDMKNDANDGRASLMQLVRQIKPVTDHAFYLFIPLSRGGEIRVKLEDNRLLQDRLKVLSYLLGEGDLQSRGSGELDLTGHSVFFRPDAA
jgi:cell division septal protein FtsQ